MGASREGFDLFNKNGRYCFWRDLKKGRFQSLMWRDTFAQIWCKIVGHNKYNCNCTNEPVQYACKRCCKYVKE